jgi:hypothetical protein
MMIKRTNARRRSRGALAAEYVSTLWVFLLFFVFPLLNLGTICMRAFFLWFACNQAVMSGCKAKTWATPVTIGQTVFLPANQLAPNAAKHILQVFPGVTVQPQNIVCQLDLVPITTASNPSPPQLVSGPLSQPVDVTSTVPLMRVQITGNVQPLIPMKLGNLRIVGLTDPMTMVVSAEEVFENTSGLTL